MVQELKIPEVEMLMRRRRRSWGAGAGDAQLKVRELGVPEIEMQIYRCRSWRCRVEVPELEKS
jgi:hypothetical protein